MTLQKRSVAIVAFAVGLLFAGATAYGVGQSVQTSSPAGSGPNSVDTVETVNYGSN
ncbi:MAG: hypothetical protein P1U38_01095 [Aeromicrobium sp.]|uniref:hypothetical protein n=1 Tax=Aeromicrobium sp. TaxID=1871063 RepID=UPI0025BA1EA8|nr:hypothetical protein [Aeromicrobium sp.]MCK5890682.1 hypothetical protein [Aeromicrobium sp.]MDF1703349.1 hypothetical protein [Aeromicrobium sp.]